MASEPSHQPCGLERRKRIYRNTESINVRHGSSPEVVRGRRKKGRTAAAQAARPSRIRQSVARRRSRRAGDALDTGVASRPAMDDHWYASAISAGQVHRHGSVTPGAMHLRAKPAWIVAMIPPGWQLPHLDEISASAPRTRRRQRDPGAGMDVYQLVIDTRARRPRAQRRGRRPRIAVPPCLPSTSTRSPWRQSRQQLRWRAWSFATAGSAGVSAFWRSRTANESPPARWSSFRR